MSAKKELSPWARVTKALDKAHKRTKELEDKLGECENELRKMTLRKDSLLDNVQHLRGKNLRLLEDYHELASDVLQEQKSRNCYSEVGMPKEEVQP